MATNNTTDATEVSKAEGSTIPDAFIRKDASMEYWSNVEGDNDAMLGGVPSVAGFGVMSKVDVQGSRNFLAKLRIGNKPGLRVVERALEGGAGIGRVTEAILLKVARRVDVIEPVAKFTSVLEGKDGIGQVFNVGLEDWLPSEGDQYDLVWTQWCVGHLTDEQLVQYLIRCKNVLNPDGGIIVVKENLSSIDVDMFDSTDSSVTRQDTKFRHLFRQAGLRIVKTEEQKGFPKSDGMKLLPVRTYALKPEK